MRTLTVGLTLLVALVGFAGAVTNQNDAGSGSDAGQSWATSVRLPGSGSYEGNLSAADAADWYRWSIPFHYSGPVCEQANVTAGTVDDAALYAVNARSATVHGVLAKSIVGQTAHLGVVTMGFDGGYLNVSPDALAPFGVTDDYHFDIAAFPTWALPQQNGGTLGSGCTAGSVSPSAPDVYTFAENAGSRITVSLADTQNVAQATLADASGNVLATIASGGLATVSLPTTGTYSMSMSASAPTSYLLGLCDPQCGPPESPCNPMCISDITG